MKVTNYGPGGLPVALGGWSSGITSINSNATTTDGGLSAINFVQRITANSSNILLNPSVNFAAGSNIILSAASNTITIASTSTGGGGTISAGSNSTRVSEDSAPGASSTLWSPYDHRHDGIGTITASSSNTLQRGTFNLRAGTGISLGLSDTDGDGELDTATINSLITSSSGGSSGTVNYPSLKPTTPTDDFDAAVLDASWSAHSTNGSFSTSNVMTRGEDWHGSSVELQFSNQTGTIYKTHGNTDLDFTVGGVRMRGFVLGGTGNIQYEVGIAALDSSGNGMCVMAFNDGNCYFAPVITYAQSGITDTWSFHGISSNANNGDWWFRLKRVSGTWTGYASQSGRTWDKTFATSSTSYTITELHFGSMRKVADYGRYMADYFQLDV